MSATTACRPPGEVTHSVLVRVDDARVHCEQARARRAKILEEPIDHMYGERQYSAEDPWDISGRFCRRSPMSTRPTEAGSCGSE